MTTKGRAVAAVLAAALMLGLVSAVPAGASSATRAHATAAKATTYVGTVDGLGASLAIVVEKDKAFGYLCDGAAVSEWLRGTVKDRAITLTSPAEAFVASAVEGSRLLGRLIIGGESFEFTLKRATGGAGLFREERVIDGVGFAAGWVTQPDGSTVGQVSAANLGGARVLEIPPPVLETPTTVAAALSTKVGVVAPAEIVAQFPPAPPPESEVTVVPFSAQEEVTEPPATNPGDDAPDVVTPTTAVPTDICDNLRALHDAAGDALNRTVRALNDASGESRAVKRALKIQISGIQKRIRGIEKAMKGPPPC